MKTLKRIRYNTLNSWNLSESLAYNLKVYNVIDDDLQDQVYELINIEGFYDEVNFLIQDFGREHDYQWQAGFNGRSGGYLVLYSGGKRTAHYTKKDFNDGEKQCYISDRYHWKTYEEAKELNLVDREIITSVYSQPGLNIELDDVPVNVRKAFRQLALNIVNQVEYMAKNATIEDEEVISTKKVISF